MKTYLTVFFAGAVLASSALAADTMKASVHKDECTKRECCRHEGAAASKGTQTFFDAWSRAKWGRNIRETNDQPAVRLAQTTQAGDSHAVCEHPKCCD